MHPAKLTVVASIFIAIGLASVAIFNGIEKSYELSHIAAIGVTLGIVIGPELSSSNITLKLKVQQAIGGMMSGFLISTYYYAELWMAPSLLVFIFTVLGGIAGAFHGSGSEEPSTFGY